MRRRAEARGIQVVPGVAEALPFPPERFDAVLMVTTICFVDDPLQAFREAWRVLRPGGYLVVGFVDRDSALGRRYEAMRHQNPFYREARFFSAGEVEQLFKATGFVELAWRQTLFSDPETLTEPEPVREGYGQGGFVVGRGRRRMDPEMQPRVSFDASPEGWQSG